MASGLVEMAKESVRFMKAQPYVTGMAIYTSIRFLMDLLGVPVSSGAIFFL